MNFAYLDLDARSMLGSLLAEEPDLPLEPIPCELPREWTDFEETLSVFKAAYVRKRRELASKMAELEDKSKDVKVLRTTSFTDPSLKSMIYSLLDKYESDEGTSALTQQCRELMGEVNEMQRVLINTMSERYASFTCFICTERLVDLFIDPCGHVVCAVCWERSGARTTKCPGCRTQVRGVKKIFTM
jgi:Zinc finger, C3HC4 type (RING finger)